MDSIPHGTPSGYSYHGCRCEVCVEAKREKDRAYYRANQDKVKAKVAAYKAADPEGRREQEKAYREANAEKLREQKQAYNKATSAARVAAVAEWRKANPEARKAEYQRARDRDLEGLRAKGREAAKRAWERDPEGMRAKARAYYHSSDKAKQRNRLRAHLRRGVQFDATANAWAEILMGDPCCYCGEPMTDLDHIDPISKGGDGGWENLTASCRSCNASKNDKPLLAWLAGA